MKSDDVKYPDCEVQLSGLDSNAGSLMGAVVNALKPYLRNELEMDSASASAEITAFRAEAMSGDYDNLLQTCMRWVSVS